MDTEIVAKSPSHQLSSDSGIYLYIVVGDNMATTLKVAGWLLFSDDMGDDEDVDAGADDDGAGWLSRGSACL